jgi:hypothetical protein
MGKFETRTLGAKDLPAAGALLHAAYDRAARERNLPPRFHSAAEAAEVAESLWREEKEGAVVALGEGGLAGVGFARRMGDWAALGPIASATSGQGAGGALVDDLCARAEGWGAGSIRASFDAGEPRAFALFAGRSFAVVDTAARLLRGALPAPRVDGARGLEIAAPRPADLEGMVELDRRLTGLERGPELGKVVTLCARRRGAVVGFLSARAGQLGPGLALDVADLGVLMARALADHAGPAAAFLSSAAPTAMLAAMGLGFQVVGVEIVAVRGLAPPARPPQLY